jgi:anthranilate synthase/aminodeoxychorismate synthase-like glutamine amidotransferase
MKYSEMNITLVDNYDSFTYNLVHYFEMNEVNVVVMLNDMIDYAILEKSDAIILSPGPGLPEQAGELLKVIKRFKTKIPILGICLGMQAIAQVYEEKIENQKFVKHGVQEQIFQLKESRLFANIEFPTQVGLYHSWHVILKEDSYLVPTSISENNILMSLENVKDKVYGLQFHPESIMTVQGKKMIQNFLAVVNLNRN